MQNFLTDFQAAEYVRIAALAGCNSHGGPGWRQLDEMLTLPARDRAPVMQAFAEEVHFRMSVDQRLVIAEAVARYLAQPAESNLCAH